MGSKGRGLSRRRFVSSTALCAVSLPAVLGATVSADTQEFPLQLSEAQWRERLTENEFKILRQGDTERPGSSPLLHEDRDGVYVCAGCGQALFSSKTKFDSGTGWPSFWAPIDEEAITLKDDRTWLVLVRTEILCSRCGGHLGHVFDDGPEPTGLRYCMNGTALDFLPSQNRKRQQS